VAFVTNPFDVIKTRLMDQVIFYGRISKLPRYFSRSFLLILKCADAATSIDQSVFSPLRWFGIFLDDFSRGEVGGETKQQQDALATGVAVVFVVCEIVGEKPTAETQLHTTAFCILILFAGGQWKAQGSSANGYGGKVKMLHCANNLARKNIQGMFHLKMRTNIQQVY
jgi:hypothetical protein